MSSFLLGIIIASIGYFFNALASLGDKFLLTRAFGEPAAYAFWSGLLGVGLILLLPFDPKPPTGYGQWLYTISAGASFLVGLLWMYRAVAQSDITGIMPIIGSFTPVFTALSAFFLVNERLLVSQFFAITVLIIGLWILTHERAGVPRKALPQAIMAAIFFALSAVSYKAVFTSQNLIPGLGYSQLGSLAVAGYLFATKASVRMTFFAGTSPLKTHNFIILVLVNIAGGLAFLLNNSAIKFTSPTIVKALQGVQYMFLFILVALVSLLRPGIIKEKLTPAIVRHKIAGIAVVVIGLIMLAVL